MVLIHIPAIIVCVMICARSFAEAHGKGSNFARLADLILANPYRTNEDTFAKEIKDLNADFGTAASIMMALTLTNGMNAKAHVSDTSYNFKTKFAGEDVITVARALMDYVLPEITENLIQGYKQRIADGINPVQAMSSAMEDVKHNRTYSARNNGKFEALGCEFDDDEYTYSKKSMWGNKALPPMKFTYDPTDDIEDNVWKQFRKCEAEASTALLKTTTYNDMDQLIRFIAEFKDQTESLESFYNSYKYKFRPSEDAVFALKYCEELEKKYTMKNCRDHFYLIPVFKDVPEKYLYTNYEQMADTLPKHFFQGHVAGAMNIVSNGVKGYLIMDLTIGSNKLISLMENHKRPKYSNTAFPDGRTTITYQLINATTRPLVVAKSYAPESEDPISTHLYLVQKPYCGFIEHTLKPNLIAPVHGMFTRQDDGMKEGQLSFKILPKKMLKSENNMTLTEYDAMSIPKVQRVSCNALFEIPQATLRARAKELRLESELQLLGKMAAVKVLIFDDEELVDNLHKLHEQFQFETRIGSPEVLPWDEAKKPKSSGISSRFRSFVKWFS